jgi:toxin ParE1/3/4
VKRYKLRFSKEAVKDIEQVLAYTGTRFGAHKHLEYKELIRLALEEIAVDPIGWPAKNRVEVHPDVWTFHIAKSGKKARHLFLYRVVDEDFVDISRLLHDSMDLRRHLPDV